MADEPPWDSYREAVVELRTPDGPVLLQADPAGPGGPFPSTGGAGRVWHVLTAWNPQGLAAPDDRNRAANLRLEELLDRRGLLHVPAEGRDAARSWHEDGFAVAGLTRAEACALGRELGQIAIYEWADAPDGFLLVVCADESVVAAQPWRSEPG